MPHAAVQGRVRGSRSCRDFKSRRKKFELLVPSPWPEENYDEVPGIGKLPTRLFKRNSEWASHIIKSPSFGR